MSIRDPGPSEKKPPKSGRNKKKSKPMSKSDAKKWGESHLKGNWETVQRKKMSTRNIVGGDLKRKTTVGGGREKKAEKVP